MINIPLINEKQNYWLIKTNNGKYYEKFKSENIITLYNLDSRDDRKKTKELSQFTEVMKENDLVLIPSCQKKLISIGIVLGIKEENAFIRHVKWLREIHFTELDPKCHRFFYKNDTLINLNEVSPYLERIVYSLYQKNEKYYFSFKINQKDNILFKSIYGLSRLVLEDITDDSLEIKLNIQSPGVIEFITKNIDVIIAIIKIIQVICQIKNREDIKDQKLLNYFLEYEIDKLQIDAPDMNQEIIEKNQN